MQPFGLPNSEDPPSRLVHSYAEASAFLSGLGPPVSGKVRVFRGQTKAYREKHGNLLSVVPNLMRDTPTPGYDRQWYLALMAATAGNVRDLVETFGVEEFFIPALIQHYGPGSTFLDVTSSIDIALWFALHRCNSRWMRISRDFSGSPRVAYHYKTVWYERLHQPWSADENPIIYIFDVNRYGHAASLEHACLVDILQMDTSIPEFAPRVAAQKASLIYVDQDKWSWNLIDKTIATIQLASDFRCDGFPKEKWSSKAMFPPPEEDPFYRLLLRLPYKLSFGPLRMEHPLKLPLSLVAEKPIWVSDAITVMDGTGTEQDPTSILPNAFSLSDGASREEMKEFFGNTVTIVPPILLLELMGAHIKIAEPSGGFAFNGAIHRLKDALPFFLETPLWKLSPDAANPEQYGFWIESALPLGIAPTLFGRRTASVYLELSALDVAPGYTRHCNAALRGIWVLSSSNEYRVSLYFQSPRGTHSAFWRTDLHFAYNPTIGRFFLESASDDNEGLREVGLKALFLTLTLLRDLSPGFKPSVVHSARFKPSGNDGQVLFRTVFPLLPHLATAEKFSLSYPDGERPSQGIYVPKSADNREYTHTIMLPDEFLQGPQNPDDWLRIMETYFPLIKDPFYLSCVGSQLAEVQIARGECLQAQSTLRRAVEAAASVHDAEQEAALLKKLATLSS
ncbi:MAG: FRG domain-containing protein [Elusimicrobia bacterium]|nr:FRG domain-containing protein [Elusimicrobiota bacterium]